jgi:hypothetical protein
MRRLGLALILGATLAAGCGSGSKSASTTTSTTSPSSTTASVNTDSTPGATTNPNTGVIKTANGETIPDYRPDMAKLFTTRCKKSAAGDSRTKNAGSECACQLAKLNSMYPSANSFANFLAQMLDGSEGAMKIANQVVHDCNPAIPAS